MSRKCLAVGNEWVGEETEFDSAGNVPRFDATVIVVSKETVTVPAGTFVCYTYKWSEPSTSDRPYQLHYLSPGYGNIKSVEYRKTAGGYIYPSFSSVLISYTLQ